MVNCMCMCMAMEAGSMHAQNTNLGVVATPCSVYTTHLRSVLCTQILGCAWHTNMEVCDSHQKKCVYRDIGSTPYLV